MFGLMDCIIILIDQYSSLNNFSITSKELLHCKKIIKYKFTQEYSLKYYLDDVFRNMILNKIHYPNMQLIIDVSHCYEIYDVDIFKNVNTLDLSHCVNVKDVSSLSNLENLNLRDAMLIFDIFSQNLEIEILDFWSRLDSIKYQEIQERIRFIYNNYYKFDVFLKNLLNVDIQNLSKYTSS